MRLGRSRRLSLVMLWGLAYLIGDAVRRRTTHAATARMVATVMGGKLDQVKGRLKEVAGILAWERKRLSERYLLV